MIHPKKGSPSGRNAYPVTEKIEEFKKEKKNDMAKKKTYQENKQEALQDVPASHQQCQQHQRSDSEKKADSTDGYPP